MALPKITAPNPAAFASDPVEQIFQRGVLDRDMSGLAFMLANAAQDRGTANASAYMQGLQQTNALASVLAKQEAEAAMQKEMLKGMITLSQHGYLPKDMPISAALFSDPNAATVSEPSTLANALMQAKINQANAAATASRSGGGDQFTIDTDVTPYSVGNTTIKMKTRNPNSPIMQQLIEQEAKRRGLQINPGTPYGAPTTAQARQAAEEAARRRRNIAE